MQGSYGYQNHNLNSMEASSGMSKITTTAPLSDAFGVSDSMDYSNLSGSSMNDYEDEDNDFPF
ncbi:hypothetical protein BPO_1759 [Bergeyella porcorum]|uniref:Single-stranded DNA-binding protein n=1 Tax=Bergeyella porcorum TaxID=1735111 RepID=A0AAU0F3W0_9FLAO